MRLIKANISIFLILLLSLALRIYQISQVPPALNWDEVSLGYNAYSVFKTGHDEWGNKLPTIFRAYGDYKLPAYVYISIPGIAVFGLTEFAVRLPSLVAGTLSILFTYFLVLELFDSKKHRTPYTRTFAALSALLMAVEPWSLFTSRIALEADIAVFFIISGTYFFLRGLRTKNYLLFASLFFGLSVWSYNSARVFVPLFLVSLVIIYREKFLAIYKISPSTIRCSLITALVFLVPMFWQLARPIGQARYGEVQILDQGLIAKINEARNNGCSRLVCNKVTYFVPIFVKNYIPHFGPRFLFFEGGSNYQFSIPERGLLHLVNLPFFYLGLVMVFLKFRNYKYGRLLIVWLLLAPTASSLTREAPHVLRSIVILPVPMILTALGLGFFLKKFKHLFVFVYLVLVLISLEGYMQTYFNDYRVNYSDSWQYGYKEMVGFVKENYDKYDKILITKKHGEPHEFILFYLKWDPGNYLKDTSLVRFYQSNWWWVDGFDKFYFVNDWEITEDRVRERKFILESKITVDCKSSKCLLIAGGQDF